MNDEQARNLPTRRVEKRLIKLVSEDLRENTPNLERIGCPGSDAVKEVVNRRLVFPGFDDVIDHIATCGPCFQEYNRQRQQSRRRKVSAAVLACMGLLLLGLFLRHNPAKPPQPNEPLAKEAPLSVFTAALDYRDWTAERSAEARSHPINVPHLTRASLDLAIKLPIGTEDGNYTVQFRSVEGQALAEAVGSAVWDGSAETLGVRINLRSLPPGTYTLAIRLGNSSWRLYSVVLD